MTLDDLPAHLRDRILELERLAAPPPPATPSADDDAPAPFEWRPREETLDRFLALARDVGENGLYADRARLRKLQTGREILALAEEAKSELLLVALVREVLPEAVPIALPDARAQWGLGQVPSLLRRELGATTMLSSPQLDVLARALAHHVPSRWTWLAADVVAPLERFVAGGGRLGEGMRSDVARFVATLEEVAALSRQPFELRERARAVLAGKTAVPDDVALGDDEPWARALRAAAGEDPSWRELLLHCRTATSARPSGRWLDVARERTEAVGESTVAAVVARVLGEVGVRWRPERPDLREADGETTTLVDDRFADVLRGLVWAAATTPSPDLVAALGGAAGSCFHKVAGHGPRSVKVGNACLLALAAIGTEAAVAHLTRLRSAVKYPAARRQVEKSLEDAARRLGMTVDELEELAVPDFGMTEVGRLERRLGDFTATLTLADHAIAWRTPSGRTQASTPAPLRASHPEALRELRRDAKDLAQAVQGQRRRLERLLREDRRWPYTAWRERYLDHPLVGWLARRLVWRVGADDEGRALVWSPRASTLVGIDGSPAEPTSADTTVRLWHPLAATREDVSAWRERLAAEGIRQPFPQAHREIYPLTDAERATAIYSNRFAGHVLAQHRLAALCRERGWSYQLQGHFDSVNAPTLAMPERDLVAELLVEPAGDETSEMGIYLHVATDQVRFCDLAGTPRRLEDVDPLLFSEVMRDVDLFVGVASVGNDPTWLDRGDRGAPYGAYWQAAAFGPLSPTAETRREVLARLLPRLAIADRCTLEERFLVVRGDRTRYRIHLGSANVKTEPDDRYLCIVREPGRCEPDPRFLPFEGDGTLSLVLSKALLLAHDREITDPGILSQLRHLPEAPA